MNDHILTDIFDDIDSVTDQLVSGAATPTSSTWEYRPNFEGYISAVPHIDITYDDLSRVENDAVMQNRIDELEKENKELKEKLKWYEDAEKLDIGDLM